MGIAKRRSAAFATAFALIASMMVVLAPAALAHHPILSVSASCNARTFQWEVTWTVANGNWSGRTMTVDLVTYPDGQLTDIGLGLSLAPNATESDTVQYPVSDTGVKTLTVKAGWNNGGPQGISSSLSIDLGSLDASGCQPPPPGSADLTVEKVVVIESGSPSTTEFDFTVTGQVPFTMEDAEFASFGYALVDQQSSVDITVTELTIGEAGWTTSISCDDEPSGTKSVDLTLSHLGNVTCTVTNTYEEPRVPSGTVVIRKITQGGTGTFGFDLVEHSEGTIHNQFPLATASQGVAVEKVFPGMSTDSDFAVSEDAPLPTGWAATPPTCVSGIEGNVPDPIDFWLEDGETVTCTFVNTYTPPEEPTTTTTTTTTIGFDVLGTTIVATTTTVVVSPATLPFTGAGNSGSALAIGIALAGLGGLVIAAFKREEEEDARANL